MALSEHSLFKVTEFALDGVRLTGAYPPEVQGKYVDLTLTEWDTMFKLVTETVPEQVQKRAQLAAIQHAKLALLTPKTHPNCLIMSAMHVEPTSSRNNGRANTVFDVRGRAVVLGDVMLGLIWQDTPVLTMLSVSRENLADTNWFVAQSADTAASQVCSMTTQN